MRDIGGDRFAALAEQCRRGRAERRVVDASRCVEPLSGDKPRERFVFGDRRIGRDAYLRHLHRPGQLDAGLDGQVLAQRDDVERRIVERAVEDDASAVDRELLAERVIGAVDRADRAASLQAAVRARRDPARGPRALASRPSPTNVRSRPRSTSTSSVERNVAAPPLRALPRAGP